MELIAHQLKALIKINRQILNQLHKDEASISSIRQAFDEREVHIQKLNEVVSTFDKDNLTDQESDVLKTLFNRFNQQCTIIGQALDYIMEKSKEKLDEAIKRREAEDSYQLLK